MPHILGLLLNILKNMNSVNDKRPHQTVTHNRNTFAHILDLILFSAQARMMIWKDRRASKWLILLTCGRLRWPNMKRETVKHISACWWQKTAESIFWIRFPKKNCRRANQADFLQAPQAFAFFHTIWTACKMIFQQIWAMQFLDIWLMMMMNNQKKLVRSAHHNIFYSINVL